ncbi:hypothetical protein [Microvirga pakistanensis]|uniref:hypothetical protein n=1 Tax=Microvirga pakistanensis TaxID=1682650 RepID=UPI00141BD885|nr:hypothetical protein [Microvirga pakistanensis]
MSVAAAAGKIGRLSSPMLLLMSGGQAVIQLGEVVMILEWHRQGMFVGAPAGS